MTWFKKKDTDRKKKEGYRIDTSGVMNRNKKNKKFLYESLAEEIQLKISQQVFQPGEKLPSVREMHKVMNNSITTISKAYELLESKGLIFVKDRSGYYVGPQNNYKMERSKKGKSYLTPKLIRRSGIVEDVLKSLGDESKIQLGVAYISPELLPSNQYLKILKNLTKKEIKKAIIFDRPEGLLKLRQQISLKYMGLIKGISPDDIIITNGCTEALVICLMAFLQKGDTVAIEVPSFYGIFTILENMGVFVLEIPASPEQGVDFDALKTAVKSKKIKCCILNSNFQNPLGSLTSDSNKKKVVKLLNDNKVPLIEDDIYSELYYEKQRPCPLKSFDKKDLVLTCSSFSKTLAPGLRVGWVIPGQKFRENILKIKSGISISTSTLDQYILTKFIETGLYDKHLRRFRNILRKQLHLVVQAIEKYFPEEIRMIIPKGGFLLWIGLPKGVNSVELYKKLLKENIVILPGPVCTSSEGFEEYIRLSCGSPFDDLMENAIKKIGHHIRLSMANK
ncbi:MAG: PLP-dependent aminotransferase family protein [Desulfobacteraceae bacterium]|nr:PLP-dependent aminotransferase family protein [Desulfobacteraceae bacterium]